MSHQLDLIEQSQKIDRQLEENERFLRVTPVDPSDEIDLSNAQDVSVGMNLDNTLILMACSATKRITNAGQELPLMDLYDGPMWQSLRLHLGTEYHAADEYKVNRYRCVVLSGKYGVVDAQTHAKTYEARLSPQKADALIRAGLFARQDWFGELNGKFGLANCPLSAMAARTTAIGTPIPIRRIPWSGVIVAGGGDYRRVFMALLRQLMQWGDVYEDATILSTHGGIGEQRSQLGQWIRGLHSSSQRAMEAA